jgi:hypothetical protein
MRPARRIKQAKETARKLKALLNSSIISQLLQRTPPAALTAQQEAQLLSCRNVINQLEAGLQEAPLLGMQLVDTMLKQQVACNISSLVTWVQQQPEQLLSVRAGDGHQGSTLVTSADRATAATLWGAGVLLMGRLAVAILDSAKGAGACSLAANLTQQLDQSGKACSRN